MIYVLEMPDQPEGAAPRVWFAFDGEDLRAKLAASNGPPDCPMHIWPDEVSAVLDFENDGHTLWQGAGWKARWALREQLVATEVLAEG
jgi:hypothetical protein